MSVSLINQPFPFERNHIRSGPIERNGFADYGVIFSARQGGSVNDFHPADLSGATLEVTELRAKGEANRFFTILGGYYCERNPGGRKDEVAISQIFGIAADASLGFGLAPGNHCLVDTWKMKDLSGPPATNMMDERDKGEDGWTFIVNYKPYRHQYPFSGKSMEIHRECPMVTSFVVNTVDSTETEVTASGLVSLLHGPARAYKFDWGDGSPVESSTSLQVTHTYLRAFGDDQVYTVTVTVIGPDGCNASHTALFTVAGHCPTVQLSSQEISYPSALQAVATLSLSGHVDGMSYQFKWGDGSAPEVTQTPNASHAYERKVVQGDYTVTVEATGPGACSSVKTTKVMIDPQPCPEIVGLTADEGQMQGGLFVIPFVIEISGPQPTAYRWDWGDGTIETGTTPTVSHGFALEPGVPAEKMVTVTIVGPGNSCEDSATVSVNIPGPCPITIVHVRPGAVTETTAAIKLQLRSQGAVPESWSIDWGDGSPIETVSGPEAEHLFARPAGDQKIFSVQATSNGPGACTQTHPFPVTIPGVCPALSNLETEWQSAEGNFYPIKATVEVSGPAPDSYEWTWKGEKITESTTTTRPEATHQFAGKPGETTPVTISVKAIGPGSCNSSTSTEATVPALPCPVLSALKVVPGAITGDKQEFSFSANFNGPTPGGFRWHWGDGSAEERTAGAEATHTFPLLIGQEKSYDVRLFSDGPGPCKSATHAMVPVAAFCPLPGTLIVEVKAPEGNGTPVTATVASTGPKPVLYVWNWGDGTPEEETTTPEVSHLYAEKFGETQQFLVSVTIKGPGTCGDQTVSSEVAIPASCPVFPKVNAVQKELKESSVIFEFELPGNHPADSYVWNLGDGTSPVTTQDARVVHEYPRWAGQTPEFQVSVQAIGPGSCTSEAGVSIVIPEPDICPIISRVDTYIADETETTVSIGFVPVSLHGAPTAYAWDFADGSPVLNTTDPEVIHEYSRSAGDNLKVKVTGSGPGNCASEQTVHVSVPAATGCPQIGALQVSGKDSAQANGYEVSATLEVVSGAPETYEWSWGDGTAPQTTKRPQASHSYSKGNSAVNRNITVSASGPGQCSSQASSSIAIPAGTSVHPWCKWWKYLVAFLASLAGGGLLVCFADYADPQPSGWLFGVLLVIILGFGVVSWLWQSLGKKRGCPPGLCDGLAVGWTMMLTMTGVAFFLNSCLPNWIAWGIICFVLAAALAGYWFMKCAKKAGARVFFIYFFIFVLAFALVVLALAMPALACV